MAASARSHREAAARHAAAAATHARASAFWREQGDAARAQLHEDAAEHERTGAAIEERWAALIEADGDAGRDPDAPGGSGRAREERAIAHEIRQTERLVREERAAVEIDGETAAPQAPPPAPD